MGWISKIDTTFGICKFNMISILMGVHRLDEFSIPAIESVLMQKGVVFEVILVCNGKNALTIKDALANRYREDDRITLLSSPIGQLSHALNIALSYAKYDYVARMDADDVAHPTRLRTQLDYLQAKKLDVLGSAVRLINAQGVVIGNRMPPSGNAISRWLPFRNPFIHPTVLMRKQVLLDAGGYCGGFNSEDYNLWLRLSRQGVQWDNAPESLLDYRIHGAASQRRLLGYAEVTGLMMRELILSKNLIWLFGVLMSFGKSIWRSR